MKLCMPHWDALKAAIEREGVARLVAKDGRAAMAQVVRSLDGTAGPDDFDPLMAANTAIWNNAIEKAGLAVMASNTDGSERCPICYLDVMHKEGCREPNCAFSFEVWIDYAAAGAAKYARETTLGDGT